MMPKANEKQASKLPRASRTNWTIPTVLSKIEEKTGKLTESGSSLIQVRQNLTKN
jgi:hypothetical protein